MDLAHVFHTLHPQQLAICVDDIRAESNKAFQLGCHESKAFSQSLRAVADANCVLLRESLPYLWSKNFCAGSHAPAVEWIRRSDRARVVLAFPVHLVPG